MPQMSFLAGFVEDFAVDLVMQECRSMHGWTHDGWTWLGGRVGKDRRLYGWLGVVASPDCGKMKER